MGRALVEQAMARVRAEGGAALHVVGNLHAEKFYRALGFTDQGALETRFGSAMVMSRLA